MKDANSILIKKTFRGLQRVGGLAWVFKEPSTGRLAHAPPSNPVLKGRT
jgi:hypothetical protein